MDFVNNVAGISLLGVKVNGVAQADVFKPTEKIRPGAPRFQCFPLRQDLGSRQFGRRHDSMSDRQYLPKQELRSRRRRSLAHPKGAGTLVLAPVW